MSAKYQIRMRTANKWLQDRVSGVFGGAKQDFRNQVLCFTAANDAEAISLGRALATDMREHGFYFRQGVTITRVSGPIDEGRFALEEFVWADNSDCNNADVGKCHTVAPSYLDSSSQELWCRI